MAQNQYLADLIAMIRSLDNVMGCRPMSGPDRAHISRRRVRRPALLVLPALKFADRVGHLTREDMDAVAGPPGSPRVRRASSFYDRLYRSRWAARGQRLRHSRACCAARTRCGTLCATEASTATTAAPAPTARSRSGGPVPGLLRSRPASGRPSRRGPHFRIGGRIGGTDAFRESSGRVLEVGACPS